MERFIKEGINIVKETDLGKAVTDALDNVIKPFIEKVLKLDLIQLAELYNEEIDALILKEEEQKNIKYIGGEFKIYYMDNDYFGTSISLYFQNKNKQWIKTSSKSKPQKMTYLNSEAITRLRTERTVIFEIAPPKKQVTDKTLDIPIQE